MIKKGDIAMNKHTNDLVEVVAAYESKNDICSENPLSVAILTVHKIRFLAGHLIGKTQTIRAATFRKQYKIV